MVSQTPLAASPDDPKDRSGAQQFELSPRYWVYILASKRNGTLYVGMTNNLARRMEEHRAGIASRFTARYGVIRLVYLEGHDRIEAAKAREHRMKRWKRSWKLELIERDNPEWEDLTDILNA